MIWHWPIGMLLVDHLEGDRHYGNVRIKEISKKSKNNIPRSVKNPSKADFFQAMFLISKLFSSDGRHLTRLPHDQSLLVTGYQVGHGMSAQ